MCNGVYCNSDPLFPEIALCISHVFCNFHVRYTDKNVSPANGRSLTVFDLLPAALPLVQWLALHSVPEEEGGGEGGGGHLSVLCILGARVMEFRQIPKE